MSAHLQAAVERLYEVFARYPLNPGMPGSPLFEDWPEKNRRLSSKPLRELSADDLREFAWEALTTWGEEPDFKHFLPRLLELLTQLPADVEPWIVLDKLRYEHGPWTTWPETEQTAVRTFLLTFWEYLLTTTGAAIDEHFDDYFAALAYVYPDFGELLQRWADSPAETATLRLVNLVYQHLPLLFGRRSKLPGFRDSPALGPPFVAWLTSVAVLTRLEAAFFATTEQDAAQRISWLVQILEQRRELE